MYSGLFAAIVWLERRLKLLVGIWKQNVQVSPCGNILAEFKLKFPVAYRLASRNRWRSCSTKLKRNWPTATSESRSRSSLAGMRTLSDVYVNVFHRFN